jgi:glycosyltransferase involved in cell wall biosynthesis
MRILYDHQLFSLQDAGGASRYYYELIRSFAGASEVRAELWLGIGATTYPFRQLSEAQAHVVSCGGFLKRGRPRYIVNEVLSNVRAPFAGRLDIYHPTLYRSIPLVRARRTVVTHHDCTVERFPHLFPNANQNIRFKRRQYAEADAIICVSESSRRDLLQFYGVDRAKTRVIHHGLARLQGSEAAAAELRGQAPGEYLLFVGRRAAYKNFNGLLRAFRATGLHKSMLLLAAGGGPLTSEERALAEELGVASSLVVLPQMADTLLAEAYAGATLFVYPSWCEGFGFPPLEAMAAGCPALVSNTSSLPEICQDAPFYFNPQNEGSFERALLEAMNDDKARQRARERGTRVAARYSWQKCGAETLALYRECQ